MTTDTMAGAGRPHPAALAADLRAARAHLATPAERAARLAEIDRVNAHGAYRPDWASLQRHREPRWYQDAKFGIFTHWGVYSVPAFGNEWYPRNMYIQGSDAFRHHVAVYGPQKDFGYQDFIPRFTGERFDPEEWAAAFAAAGARYAVPVAEHHDGFQMYASDLSPWNAADMGPHRDVVAELARAYARHGIVTGVSTHRVEHWFFFDHGMAFDSDVRADHGRGSLYWPAMPGPASNYDQFSEPAPDAEFLDDWLLRTCELIDRFHPKVLYFDWWILHSAVTPYLRRVAAYYYNRAEEWGEEVTICYKNDAMMFGTGTPDIERGQLAEATPFHWQTDTAISLGSWCHTEGYRARPAAEIVQDLVDIVSKNGNLLLNVAPQADGTLCEEDRAVLEAIGGWLGTNGEAIHGAKPWRRFGEGPTEVIEGQFADARRHPFTSADARYTVNGDALYAIAMRPSATGDYRFARLGEGDAEHNADFHGIVRDVTVLGRDTPVTWRRDAEGLHAHADGATGDMPVVFRVRIA